MGSVSADAVQFVPLVIILGFFLLFTFLIGRQIARKSGIQNLPSTDLNVLREGETLLPTLPGFAAFGESARPIRLAPEARGAAIVVGVFGVIGIGLGVGCFYRLAQDVRFTKEGQTAMAMVQGTDVSALGKGGRRTYRVRYEFEVGGQQYEGSGDLPSYTSLRNAERTQQVSVLYLESDPRINRPTEARGQPVAIAILMPLALLLPLTVFVYSLRRDRELIMKGQLAPGRVIGIVSGGRKNSLRYYYDFADAAGEVRRGSSWLQKYSPHGITVGSPAHVVYLTDDPTRNSLLLALSWRVEPIGN